MTRAEEILFLYEMSDLALSGLALGGGALLAGTHYMSKAMLRRSLREVGYLDHPTNPNLMVHSKTGRTYSLGFGHPHD